LKITLPNELHSQCAQAGYMPQQTSAKGNWLTSAPSTYVIDRDGRIVLASIDADYRYRLAPAHILICPSVPAEAHLRLKEKAP
jgi:peroxiredoxin